jgi:hypothetical protein
MNTNKIERYYPLYLDMLRTQAVQPHRGLLGMMENQLRAETLLASARHYSVGLKDHENAQQRFDHVGCITDEVVREFVPARVFDWAQVQLLTLPACTALGLPWVATTGWVARAQAFTPAAGLPGQLVPPASQREASVYVERQGTAADFAPVLRGLRAYQAKQRKRARRLLAQLWTYHWRQLVAQQHETVETKAAAEGRVAA